MSQSPTPDPSWKGLPSWLIFAFFVIGPPAALVTFTRTMTQNPALTVFIILGYEAVLFILRFAGKIWQQIEDPLVERIGQWFNLRLLEMFSLYYRQYRRYIVAEHQIFDIKGLSTKMANDLLLDQVFVDLQIRSLSPHQASSDPVHPPVTLQGTHSIWVYLSTSALANPHLVILGAPGSGKTTLLKHLALTLAQPHKYRRRLKTHSFPILLFLRDHAQTIMDQPSFSLADMVERHIKLTWQLSIPASWIGRQLGRGKCLVMLDGLDEVADHSMRQGVVDWVRRQLIRYEGNRFVLTSRPHGYRENQLDGAGITVMDVQTFTPTQIERFLEKWYLANELKSLGNDGPAVKINVHKGVQDLLTRIHQAPALLSLAINPLLLTMIAIVHRYRSSLPGKRVDLYAEICEVFLGKRYEARGIRQELSPAQKRQVLQPLAYWMMLHGVYEINRQEVLQQIEPVLEQVSNHMESTDFLQLIENTSGLFLEKNPDSYGFAHLTFQEYLAAVHIKEEGKEDVLLNRVTDDQWYETIRLYCAQADASAVVQACLAVSPLQIEDTLLLALECEEEKLKIQPQVQARLYETLKTSIESADPERRQLIAKTLLKRRLRRMIRLRENTYIDTSLVTCVEYQLFLDEQKAQGHYRQPDHWTTASFPTGSGSSPVLGVYGSDAEAFCEWLTSRDREEWHYRLPHAKEWPVEERKQWKELRAETGYWTDDEVRFEWVHGEPPRTFQESVDLILAGAFASDFKRIFNSIGDLDHARIRVRVRARSFARDLDHISTYDHDRASSLVHALSRDLGPAVDLAHARERERASAVDRDPGLALERVLARNRARDRALDLYALHLLLEERIAGNFPAYEGILLVKERLQVNNKPDG